MLIEYIESLTNFCQYKIIVQNALHSLMCHLIHDIPIQKTNYTVTLQPLQLYDAVPTAFSFFQTQWNNFENKVVHPEEWQDNLWRGVDNMVCILNGQRYFLAEVFLQM